MNIATPGGTNDVRAYEGTDLPNMVMDLPYGKYVISDNAYINTEHLSI